ncbi:glycosyltransferase family 39 protein [bacterium]|nr:glycosyltransferase family 39 protein [bacterium]
MTKERKILILALVLGLLIRFAALWLLDAKNFLYNDERFYFQLAKSLSAGMGLFIVNHFTARVTPMYPLFLSIPLHFCWSLTCARVFQIFFILPGVLLIYRLSKVIFHSEKVAAWTALVYSVYPPIVYISLLLYPQFILSLIILLVLNLVIDAYRTHRENFWQYLLFGIIFGVGVLTVPTFIAFFIVSFAFLFFRVANRAKFALWVVLGFLLVWGPWVVRNYNRFGVFIPLSTGGGEVLVAANHPDATPSSYVPLSSKPWINEMGKYLRMGEIERNRELSRLGFSYLFERKLFGIPFILAKFANFFRPYPKPITEVSMPDWLYKLIYALCWVPVFIFGVLGIFRMRKSREVILILSCIIVFAFIYAIYLTRVRYRIPIEPIFLVFAVGWLLERFGVVKLSEAI